MTPFVTLKLATSLDGRIATASGESRWITGPDAREAVHRLRAQHDAVLVGIGTALADDPELTVRLPDHDGPQPTRVVLDSRLRLSPESKLAQSARHTPVIVVTAGRSNKRLTDLGVRVIEGGSKDGRPDIAAAMRALAAEGLGRIFVEGGGEVAASLLGAGLVDRLEWFRAPVLLGAEGRPAVGVLEFGPLASAPRWRRLAVEVVGDDLWERYERL